MANTPYPRHGVITFIWDFDKTLTRNYMQNPLFEAYGVDAQNFWDEVRAEVKFFEDRKIKVDADGAYLNRMVRYAEPGGPFDGLTRARLRELGAEIEFVPGVLDFFKRSKELVQNGPYERFELKVEHWIASTGLRPMIEGSQIGGEIAGVYANDFIDVDLPPQFSPSKSPVTRVPEPGRILRAASMSNNTDKTAAIFEISKGVGIRPGINVNTNMPSPEDLRVPIENMIYIADGPSDVPAFKVVRSNGGRTLAVYAGGPQVDDNYKNALSLEDQERVHSIAEADYSLGTAADRWLMANLIRIADRICIGRDKHFSSMGGAPEHVGEIPKEIVELPNDGGNDGSIGLELGRDFRLPAAATGTAN